MGIVLYIIMITEANLFKLKRFKDTYKLYNLTNVKTSYTLYSLDCNNVSTSIESNTIEIDSYNTLNLVKDGSYKIVINNEKTIYFNFYPSLRDKVIKAIRTTLCCKCNNSINEIDNSCIGKEGSFCIRNQGTFNLVQSYLSFIKPESYNNPNYYNTYLFNLIQRLIVDNKCFINQELCNQLLHTCLNGTTTNNQRLYKYYIGLYYTALYLYELSTIDISDTSELVEEQKLFITNKYYFDKIKHCLIKVGININDILDNNMNDNTVYYYQLNNPSITPEQELLNITLSYLDNKANDVLSVFKQGKIIEYNLIGRLVFIIKDVDNTNFLLFDSLGNDITDSFVIEYDSNSRLAIFISIAFYTPSAVYFKFKTL